MGEGNRGRKEKTGLKVNIERWVLWLTYDLIKRKREKASKNIQN
jgi:hypothetical protein